MPKTILVVYHTMGGNTAAAAAAVASGVRSVPGVEVVVKLAADADENDLLACDAVCLGTPDYHNYMAGMLKDFLDRTYYPTEGKVTGKPYGAFVTHGGDGLAAESVATVCGYFKFQRVAETVSVFGRPNDAAEKELRHLGVAMAKAVL
jgi:multimeric flavodoxin WrbA